MRVMDKRPKITRRQVLSTGTASLVAFTIMPGGIIVGAGNAWAAKTKSLKPQTFATLVQMARDIYPHDFVADKFYAGVVSGFDDAAAKSNDDSGGSSSFAAVEVTKKTKLCGIKYYYTYTC